MRAILLSALILAAFTGPAYDIANVGLAVEQPQFNYTVTTTDCGDLNSGNSNCGHEFGTRLPIRRRHGWNISRRCEAGRKGDHAVATTASSCGTAFRFRLPGIEMARASCSAPSITL
jgi:hypothetical protein